MTYDPFPRRLTRSRHVARLLTALSLGFLSVACSASTSPGPSVTTAKSPAEMAGAALATTRTSGTTVPIATAPTTPAAPVAPPSVVLASDSFDRAGMSLGRPDAGLRWGVVSGSFLTVDGQARVGTSAGDTAYSIALLDVGQPVVSIRIRMNTVRAGSGLVFRYKDFNNFFSLEAAPDVATWNLFSTVDGTRTLIGNVGTAPVSGGATLQIDTDRFGFDLAVASIPRVSFRNTDLAASSGVGLIAFGSKATEVQWDDLTILGS